MGRKPPSVLSGIRLSTHGVCPGYHQPRACTGEDSPFHPFSPFDPRWVSVPSLPQASHTSSVRERGLVSVPVPAISRPGLAPGHLPGRWGDFPRKTRKPDTHCHTVNTRRRWVSCSITSGAETHVRSILIAVNLLRIPPVRHLEVLGLHSRRY